MWVKQTRRSSVKAWKLSLYVFVSQPLRFALTAKHWTYKKSISLHCRWINWSVGLSKRAVSKMADGTRLFYCGWGMRYRELLFFKCPVKWVDTDEEVDTNCQRNDSQWQIRRGELALMLVRRLTDSGDTKRDLKCKAYHVNDAKYSKSLKFCIISLREATRKILNKFQGNEFHLNVTT